MYKNKIPTGHVQRVFIMYHGTSPACATSIIKEGFRPSTVSTTTHGMLLGQGVYVSRDIRKAIKYGKVVLKLLVYPGEACHIYSRSSLVKSWQQSYDCAWVPPFVMAPSLLEETCIKDPGNIKVLGVVIGRHLVEQISFSVVASPLHRLEPTEEIVLTAFMKHLKLGYFYLRHISTGKILSVDKDRLCSLVDIVDRSSCTCHALWCWLGGVDYGSSSSEGHKGSLCSKWSGRVLTINACVEGMWLGKVTCRMADYGINFPVWTENTKQCQVLKFGWCGEILHQASGQFLTVTRDVNNNQGWVGLSYDRDYWETLYCGLCTNCDKK